MNYYDEADYISMFTELGFNLPRGHKGLVSCHLHTDKSPSISIDLREGLFNCFSCGLHGRIDKYYRETTGQSFAKKTTYSANELKNLFKARAKPKVISTEKSLFKATFDVYKGTQTLREWLQYRGVDENVADAAKVFYGSVNITYKNDEGQEKTYTVHDRVVFPIYDEKHQDYRKPKRVGDLIKNEGLGKVLKAIAEHGKDGFYDGEVADAIVDTNQAHGGVISKADLTRAKTAVVKTTPLEFTYNGYDIHTSAIPAAGGIVLAEILNMLESYCEDNQTTLKEIGFGTEEYLHLYALASQLAYADKRYYVADNAINPATNKSFISVPVDGLISKDYAKARFNAVYDPTQAFVADLNHDFGGANNANPWDYDTVNTDVQEYLYPTNQQDDGTTSLSVVDKDGNICTITETINTYWGSFVMPEGTGFFLNNQMADFSFNQLSVNRIEPYKSPISSMTPTIISKDGKNVMTVGCPGSATIPTAVCQVIIGVLDFDLDIQEAIQRKRIECLQLNDSDISYLGYEPGTEVDKKLLKMEETPAAWGQDVVDALNGKDYFCCFDGAVTHVYGLTISYDDQGNVKEYMAGADTRKDGKSLAY